MPHNQLPTTSHQPPATSPRFLRGLQANLRYWQGQTAVINDDVIRDLNPDFPNLLQAVEMGLVLAETWRETAVLILQCFFWVEGSGRVPQWQPLLEKCLAVIPAPDDWLEFRLLKQLGQFQRIQWELDTAVTTFQQAAAIAQAVQNDQAIAEIHMNLCQTYHRQHRYDEAKAEGAKALALFTEAADRLKATTLQSLGQIASEQGQYALAESCFRQALTITQQQETVIITDVTRTMNLLAITYQEQKQYVQALQIYREIAELLDNTTQEQDKIESHINLGSLYYGWNKLDQAENAFRHAERLLKQQNGMTFLKALVANNLGCVLRDIWAGLEAEHYYLKSANLYRQIGSDLMLANVTGNLAKLYMRQGRFSEALSSFDDALLMVNRIPHNDRGRTLQTQYEQKKAELVQILAEKGLADSPSANPC